jgi:methionyl-tRNA formyltransferase
VPLAAYLLETSPAQAPFATGPLFEAEENAFEMEHFFSALPAALNQEKAHYVDRCGSPQGLALLESLQPDFGVVFGARRLPAAVIGSVRDGLINVHRGISQAYRGLDSDLWAIYHGDYDNLGVTIHRVDESLDTGCIVYQQQLPLERSMRTWQLRYHTSVIATDLVHRALTDYLGGRLACRPQPQRGRYYSFMPLDLKRLVAAKFDRHCEQLDG